MNSERVKIFRLQQIAIAIRRDVLVLDENVGLTDHYRAVVPLNVIVKSALLALGLLDQHADSAMQACHIEPAETK